MTERPFSEPPPLPSLCLKSGPVPPIQLTAPDALRGRVMSLYAVVFAGVTPFGALAIGYVAEALGAPTACAVGGAGGLLSVAMLTVLWRSRRTA